MTQQSNAQFVNDLFDKLFSHVDTDMIDLHDSDCCDDHLQFEQLVLDVTDWFPSPTTTRFHILC